MTASGTGASSVQASDPDAAKRSRGEAAVGSGALASGDTACHHMLLDGAALLGGPQGSSGSDASDILAQAHPPAPEASVLHPPAPNTMQLPAPAFLRGGAAELNGPAASSTIHMRDTTLRAEASLCALGSAFLLALGSAPHSREVRDTVAFAVEASTSFRQEPSLCPAYAQPTPSLHPAYVQACPQPTLSLY